MKGALRSLAPANLLSWPTFIVSFVFTTLIHLTDARVIAAGIGWQRLLSLVVAQLVLFGVLWVASLPLRRTHGWMLAVGTIAVIVIGSAVRGWSFDTALVSLGGVPKSMVGYYVVTSTVFFGLTLTLLTIIVGQTRRRRATRTQLLADQASLRLLTLQAAADVETTDNHAAETIQARILQALEPADAQGADAARADIVLATLRATVDDVVRPISHALEETSQQWQSPTVPRPQAPTDWAGALRAACRPAAIRSLPTAAIAAAVAIPAAAVREGPVIGLLVGATMFASGMLSLTLVRALAIRLVSGRRPSLESPAFFISLAVSGFITGLATVLPLAHSAHPTYLVVQASVFFPIMGAVIATIAAARARADAVDDELRAVSDDLRWSLVRVQETHRQHQQALSRALHGRVQSTLSASHAKLSRLAASGNLDAAAIDAAFADINAAVAWLSSELTTPLAIDETLRKTRVTWAGVATVEADIEENLRVRINGDAIASATLRDLVPELCFNACKHADASAIAIAIATDGPRVIRLSVSNNGLPGDDLGREGLGDRVLTGATLRWERARVGDLTVTSAWIPLP